VRPLIGLTTYAEQARFGVQDTFAAVLPLTYVRAVHVAGGRAVLITPDDPDTDVLDNLDGLVLTGGADVAPARYGERPHQATYVRPDRDTAEMLLLGAALETDLPVLGICRGAQLMAVAAGGRLHQHLPEVLGHYHHRPAADPRQAGRPPLGEHLVTLAPGSLAHKILGASLTVNSFHHQGVADPGGLTPTGWCPEDELIEAVEDPGRAFALGVQWHPEDMVAGGSGNATAGDLRLFSALVEAAREYRSQRSGTA
jgi:putative glutamine amidotransferase